MSKLSHVHHNDENILLDHKTGDDAAIYKIDERLSLVLTLDFFAPIVDEGFVYGEIAAANALSDIYAVGGKPIIALNIAAFPRDLPIEIISSILEGGLSKAKEANTAIVGGHTIEDKEPKYGMAVTGFINTGEQITNSQAMTGDILILTKPIGTGIITTALRNNKDLLDQEYLDNAIASMTQLNNIASKAMNLFQVKAATDITGFGLLGHLHKMMIESKQSAIISENKVPILKGARELVEKNIFPGGTTRNLEYVKDYVDFSRDLTMEHKNLLADPQTSGGILMSVKESKVNELSNYLNDNGLKDHKVIGEITDKKDSTIKVSAI